MSQILCRPDNIVIEAKAHSSVLASLLEAKVPHPHACGGNAACSTCRIMILEGSENCRLMTAAEKALAERLDLPVHIRLACQTRITGDIAIQRLVLDGTDIDVAKNQLQARTIGRQADTAIMAISLRGISDFDEKNFPYDIVYTLGRFYNQMGTLVQQYQGSLGGQNGLRSLALFGLKDSPEQGIRQAMQTALALQASVQGLNGVLRELSYPQVRLTVAIHYGSTILLNADPQDPGKISLFGKSVAAVTWMDESNVKLDTQLLISPAVYESAKDYISKANPHQVPAAKGSSKVKLWEVQEANPGLSPLPATAIAEPEQMVGWQETIQEWLRAWGRF
ncbi:MAG: 2Fe-2S iron-sulfur cluster binding domain-containing protein [Synechococcaceae cyanobacterium SM2_3_2]|nr:2Fe-2S iron-sulfur cluster binding domain-containing protein [Synechococcaceae cyanobacterium SM2_3_2]